MDNKNVQEIWDVAEHPNLTIENGKVSFHRNPKLCIGLVHAFVRSVGLESVTDGKDVDEKSNGDQVPCTYCEGRFIRPFSEGHSFMLDSPQKVLYCIDL